MKNKKLSKIEVEKLSKNVKKSVDKKITRLIKNDIKNKSSKRGKFVKRGSKKLEKISVKKIMKHGIKETLKIDIKKIIEKRVFLFGLVVLVLVLAIFLGIYFNSLKGTFSVNPSYSLRFNVPAGGEAITSLKVMNNRKLNQSFNLSLEGINSSAFSFKKQFVLGPKEARNIEINFNDTADKVKVYIGKLIIKTRFSKKEIPIILNVVNPSYSFVIISKSLSNYQDVHPDGKLVLDMKIFDIKSVSKKRVNISYFLKDSNGNLIFSEENQPLIIQGSYGFSKSFDLNKSIIPANYFLILSIDYNNIKSNSVYIVPVSEEDFFSSKKFLHYSLFFFFSFLLFLILYLYFLKTRNKLFNVFKEYQGKKIKKKMGLMKFHKIKMIRFLANIKKRRAKRKLKKKILRKAKKKLVKQKKRIKSGKKRENKLGKKISRKRKKK